MLRFTFLTSALENIVHNRVNSGVDLSIPEKYVVLDQIFLEPFWKEFTMSWSYWGSALKNIVGFIPLGFLLLRSVVRGTPGQRVALMAVFLGALSVSLLRFSSRIFRRATPV